MSKQSHQHMADMVLPAKKDGEDADFTGGVIDIKPVDRAINTHIANPRQDIVAGRAANGKRR